MFKVSKKRGVALSPSPPPKPTIDVISHSRQHGLKCHNSKSYMCGYT